MDFLEYQQQAKRTATPQDDFVAPAPQYFHWAFGIIGEFMEVVGAWAEDYESTKIELGDLFWYVANFCTEFDIDVELLHITDLPPMSNYPLYKEWVPRAFAYLGLFSETFKKHEFYQRRDKTILKGQIVYMLFNLLLLVRVMMANRGHNLSDVFEANIAKLQVLYPEGFDA